MTCASNIKLYIVQRTWKYFRYSMISTGNKHRGPDQLRTRLAMSYSKHGQTIAVCWLILTRREWYQWNWIFWVIYHRTHVLNIICKNVCNLIWHYFPDLLKKNVNMSITCWDMGGLQKRHGLTKTLVINFKNFDIFFCSHRKILALIQFYQKSVLLWLFTSLG